MILFYIFLKPQIFFPRSLELETNRWFQTSTTSSSSPPQRHLSRQNLLSKPKKFTFKQGSKDSSNVSQMMEVPYRQKKYLLTDSPISSKIDVSPSSSVPPHRVVDIHPSLDYDYPPRSTTSPPPAVVNIVEVHSTSTPSLDQHGMQNQIYYTGNSLGLYDPSLGVVSNDGSQLNPLALCYTSPIGESFRSRT